jgi:thiol-disulfide isomerase/thioredoxin
MSRLKLKKELQKLSKEQIIEQVLDLYDANKSVKEFYKFYLNPESEKELMEKYKKIIVNEFEPTGRRHFPQGRYSVAKKAIADFKTLRPSPDLVAELMLTLVENACICGSTYGGFTESFYTSIASNFESALVFLKKENLLDNFKSYCEKCLKLSEKCGYFLTWNMKPIYLNYYNESIK